MTTDVLAAEAGLVETSATPTRSEWAVERWLRRIVEVPAAVVVAAEVLILFVGIVARAGFHRPIVWTDELASILFLWLAIPGSAIAVQRTSHMRLTFFVSL